MSHSVTGRLNKAANEFVAGESVGFSVRLGVKFYDRISKSEQWTNYEATIFVKQANASQVEYHRKMLVEGAIVEVSGTQQAIRQFQGANGLSLSIELIEARIGFLGMGAPKDNANQGAQQQSYNQPPQNQQQGYNQPPQNQQQAYNQPPQNQQQAYNQQAYNPSQQQPAQNQQPVYNQQAPNGGYR